MPLFDRWTITYKTPAGERITCTGLYREGVETIARAQHALGSTEILSFKDNHRPGARVECWGTDVNGRVCVVGAPRR